MLASSALGQAASRTRVVNGGTVQTPSEAPWSVRISIGNANYCSGTLVDPNRVVTAAHCVVTDDGDLRSLGSFTVVAGIVSSAADADVSTRQQRSVSAVRAHPRYERDEVLNDVGQLILSAPFDVTTSAVRPIGLVLEGAGPVARSTLRLIGWGATGDGGGSSDKRLHTLDLTQKPGWMCDSGRPSILCGTPPQNSSTCAGDSGAGLVTPSAVAQLAGVHSGQSGSPACQLNGISREMDVSSPEIHQWLSGNDAPPAAARTSAYARLAGDPTVGETLECQAPPWTPAGSLRRRLHRPAERRDPRVRIDAVRRPVLGRRSADRLRLGRAHGRRRDAGGLGQHPHRGRSPADARGPRRARRAGRRPPRERGRDGERERRAIADRLRLGHDRRRRHRPARRAPAPGSPQRGPARAGVRRGGRRRRDLHEGLRDERRAGAADRRAARVAGTGHDPAARCRRGAHAAAVGRAERRGQRRPAAPGQAAADHDAPRPAQVQRRRHAPLPADPRARA